eukprot:TRINITY_DN5716_c0_g1_i1.p1 TRINITY_DN5716_c0_g1~~TRINITY_DN5716_c0_g1_i1.p1  ORF type:complete len:326 (+),score=39.65 TRINITY_DN5716_c0_g1_i1:38-979(+)
MQFSPQGQTCISMNLSEMDGCATPRDVKLLANELLYGKSQVVFCMEQRGLRNLCRGFRTPDPSPTRTEAGLLPKCAAYNVKEVSSRSSTPERGIPGQATNRCEPAYARIRTPSPEPLSRAPWTSASFLPLLAQQIYAEAGCKTGQGYAQMDFSLSADAQRSTPWADAGFDSSPPLASLGDAWKDPSLPADAQRSTPWADAGCDSSPPLASSGDAWMDLSMPADAQCGTPWADAGCVSSSPPLAWGTVVSRGSVGHPHSCSAACKYAAKGRGCKDGADCDRCHLCAWKRSHRSRKKADSNMSGEQEGSMHDPMA